MQEERGKVRIIVKLPPAILILMWALRWILLGQTLCLIYKYKIQIRIKFIHWPLLHKQIQRDHKTCKTPPISFPNVSTLLDLIGSTWPFLCVCESKAPSNNDKGVSIDTIQAWVQWVDWCCFEGCDKASILLLPGTSEFCLSYKYFYLVKNLLCRIQILIQSTLCTYKPM